jgi:hypothetical protein
MHCSQIAKVVSSQPLAGDEANRAIVPSAAETNARSLRLTRSSVSHPQNLQGTWCIGMCRSSGPRQVLAIRPELSISPVFERCSSNRGSTVSDMLAGSAASRGRWWLTLIFGISLVVFGCDQSDPPAVVLTKEWAEAAVAGEFEQAGRLTYGEAGEPEGLNGLARTLNAYGGEYGPPVVKVGNHDEIGDLEFVCLRFDYRDFAVDGGMVLRTWPEQGLKLWEYRPGLSTCVDVEPGATSTLPEVQPSP